jgi:cytochrome c oxidase cbb3-type subunit 3
MSLRFPRPEPVALAVLLAVGGCQREDRDYRGPPPPGPAAQPGVSPTLLHVGGQPSAPPNDRRARLYENNAWHISEGKKWYDGYNCYGCHAAGGGDIGPPLMDDRWRYGGTIEQIHASIVQGRPNGMPSFYQKMPDETVWEIAAYVRSMSGNVDKNAASSRGDEIRTGEPRNQVDPAPPRADQPVAQQGLPAQGSPR